jgi:CRISP-associated protein Cas1
MLSGKPVQGGVPAPSGRFVLGGLYDAFSRHDALWAAWEKVRANAGAAGGDGISIAQFQASAEGRISQLSHRLREGRYAPGPVRRVHVPKPKGGFRPLDIPCIADRIAQAAVAAALMPVLEPEFEDSSFAYRPGRSVAQAVRRVMAHRREGFRHVVDGDIVRYFEQIPHGRLIARLEQHVSDAALLDLIGIWLEHHSHTERGVPQGSPLSPILANLYLDSIDEAIEARGVRLVRYADDFLLLCKSEALAGDAMAAMAHLLAEHGLELHPDKSRLIDFDRGFRFLGHVFVKGMVWQEIDGPDGAPSEDVVAAAEAATLAFDQKASLLPPPPDPAEDAPPRGRYAARQRVVYVLEPGRHVSAAGESFIISDRCDAGGEGGEVLISLPYRRVDRIEIARTVSLDAAALDLAAASGTVLVRTGGFGETLGQWHGADGARAARQLAQAAIVLDPAKRLAQARLIVGARIRNQRVQIKRMSRTRPDGATAVATQRMDRLVRSAERKLNIGIPELMGFEGEAAQLYWPVIAELMALPEMFSGRRRRREGHDPINAALDLISGFLLRDLTVAIERSGLNPGFGLVHETADGADALAYDLMEAFRAPIVEACVFAAAGRKAFTLEHVEAWGRGWRLTRDGYRMLVRQYEAWVQRPILSPHSGEKVLWRGLFEEEAIAFAHACERGETYQPYLMDY